MADLNLTGQTQIIISLINSEAVLTKENKEIKIAHVNTLIINILFPDIFFFVNYMFKIVDKL